jgi:hypothetical protein
MTMMMQQLVQACWESPVYGDSYVSSADYADFERLAGEIEREFIASFTPIITKGMPELSTELCVSYIRTVAPQIIGLYSTLGVELRDIDRLTSAHVYYGLLYWCNNFLDRGDLTMEAALRLLLAEQGAFPAMDSSTRRKEIRPDPFNASMFAVTNPSVVQARLGALREIAPQIRYICRPEDAAVLLHDRGFAFPKHSLGILRFSRFYLQEGGDEFWKEHAYQYVKHLILSISLFGLIGLIYAMYRRERPLLPCLADIMEELPLMRYVEGLCNAAARIFDDVGDQEIDAGIKPPRFRFDGDPERAQARVIDDPVDQEIDAGTRRLKQVSLFNTPEPRLIQAYFQFIGISEEELIEQAIKAFQMGTYEGDSAILRLFVNLLRDQLGALPQEILQKYSVYIGIVKRCMDAAYVNVIGDKAIGM